MNIPNDAAMSECSGPPLTMVPRARYVRDMGQAMVVIRQYLNEMEALVARAVLEAHEIPAVVLRDDAGGMLPAMHILYPVRLAMRVQDSSEAYCKWSPIIIRQFFHLWMLQKHVH